MTFCKQKTQKRPSAKRELLCWVFTRTVTICTAVRHNFSFLFFIPFHDAIAHFPAVFNIFEKQSPFVQGSSLDFISSFRFTEFINFLNFCFITYQTVAHDEIDEQKCSCLICSRTAKHLRLLFTVFVVKCCARSLSFWWLSLFALFFSTVAQFRFYQNMELFGHFCCLIAYDNVFAPLSTRWP